MILLNHLGTLLYVNVSVCVYAHTCSHVQAVFVCESTFVYFPSVKQNPHHHVLQEVMKICCVKLKILAVVIMITMNLSSE